jgi:hypothetical protein
MHTATRLHTPTWGELLGAPIFLYPLHEPSLSSTNDEADIMKWFVLLLACVTFRPGVALFPLEKEYPTYWKCRKLDIRSMYSVDWPSKPTMQEFAAKECKHLPGLGFLSNLWLGPWRARNITAADLLAASPISVRVENNVVSLHGPKPKTENVHKYKHQVGCASDVFVIPDVVLPLRDHDTPFDTWQSSGGPMFGFCSKLGFSDIPLFTYEAYMDGHLGIYPCSNASDGYSCTYREKSRAGRFDTRIPKAVWRGGKYMRAHIRKHLFEHALEYSEFLDMGSRAVPLDDPWYRPSMAPGEQVDKYKYQLYVDGAGGDWGCASGRLGWQLLSDALILRFFHPRFLWFTPLVQPFVHYLPVALVNNTDNLGHMIKYAEENPLFVEEIVTRSTEFAKAYLSDKGQLCYFATLLSDFIAMVNAHSVNPTDQ